MCFQLFNRSARCGRSQVSPRVYLESLQAVGFAGIDLEDVNVALAGFRGTLARFDVPNKVVMMAKAFVEAMQGDQSSKAVAKSVGEKIYDLKVGGGGGGARMLRCVVRC